MIDDITNLLERYIEWTEEISNGTQFHAYIDGELCQLTMNDYPDGPLYTLKWKDSAVDLDDRPNSWKFPPMK